MASSTHFPTALFMTWTIRTMVVVTGGETAAAYSSVVNMTTTMIQKRTPSVVTWKLYLSQFGNLSLPTSK